MATETLKCKKCKHQMEDYMIEYGKVVHLIYDIERRVYLKCWA